MLKAEMGLFVITSVCTLKCKKCVTFTPYKQNPHHQNKEMYFASIKGFFDIYDYIEHADLEGGETLLHPDIIEIIQEFLKYKKQYGELRLLTNGTVMPSETVWDVLQSIDAFFMIIDDYGNLSPKVQQIEDEAKRRGIHYRIDHYYGTDQYCGGWIDMSDLSQKINDSPELMIKALRNCRQGNYQPEKMKPCIYDGKLCLCTAQASLMPHIPLAEGEYIDLLDESVSIKQKKDIAKNFGKQPVSACAYCKGFDVTNGIRCQAAEQL